MYKCTQKLYVNSTRSYLLPQKYPFSESYLKRIADLNFFTEIGSGTKLRHDSLTLRYTVDVMTKKS